MARLLTALIGGILIGILAMLAADRLIHSSDQPPGKIVRDILDVPTMPQAVAERHREERYVNLSSIQEVVALPTEFARAEALHVLAGRTDSAGIQNLIFEANRIANEIERVTLLKILFFRLAETDPESALALARIDFFNGVKSIEQLVWRAWGRRDLDSALFAAKTQASTVHQNRAAQSLYAAYGYIGNKNTDRIEKELGIGPDRSSRSRYLYGIADKSPADAIAFINGLERGEDQQQYVSWLANYLSSREAAAALQHQNLFLHDTDGERFSGIINRDIARDNPRATIEGVLAGERSARTSGQFHSAIRALASTDLEATKQYYEQARSSDDRRQIGSAIASEIAKENPDEALAWARANDQGQFPYFQMSVLQVIVQTDPQLAISEALNSPNTQIRSNLISNVLQHIARNDPAAAIAGLDQIENQEQKTMASQQLVSAWIQYDAESAVEWILGKDQETAQQMIQQAGYMLIRSDIDAAIRLLPRIDEQSQGIMRQQIAENLATSHSSAEAQNFIRQFEGQPGYDQLQASVISGVAQTDVLMARQLADQLADSNARDQAYVRVIAHHAQTDPVDAARWLSSVRDDRLRSAATGQIAGQWSQHDPVAATRWVSNLPAGLARDGAIVQMSYRWRNPTAEQTALIASIEDRDMRGQAKIRQIYNVMRSDPVKARELLADEDIPSYQRQQVESTFAQFGFRF